MNQGTSDGLLAIAHIAKPNEQHWVGDGFRVNTVFSPHIMDAQLLSPFLLMDHAAPREFSATDTPRGVGEHPHRGFETVTFTYQGEVAHRDSYGGGGLIGPGDVQWMTAASGVVHEEFHSPSFTQSGGIFEMVQLWVNLPAKLKMKAPGYQRLAGESFPTIALGSAQGRLIAGEMAEKLGPAKTNSPITVFDLEFKESGVAEFEMARDTTTLLFMLQGDATVQGEHKVSSGGLVVFAQNSVGKVLMKAEAGVRALVLNGEPLNEPVVAYGPFVMNTKKEISQAISDYQAGKMGSLQPEQGAST